MERRGGELIRLQFVGIEQDHHPHDECDCPSDPLDWTQRFLELPMIHYTCDRCKRSINPETEIRYMVEIDIRVAGVPQQVNAEQTDDLDQLAELHDQLEREMSGENSNVVDAELEYVGDQCEGPDQYDLCEQCHESFANNPLGKEVALGFGFSNN